MHHVLAIRMTNVKNISVLNQETEGVKYKEVIKAEGVPPLSLTCTRITRACSHKGINYKSKVDEG